MPPFLTISLVPTKGNTVSAIYANAVDSFRIGIEFFLRQQSYSSRKHAILTVFHSIELLLKERLHRENPLFIYRDIDQKITEDSITVSIKESLARLDNLAIGLPKDERKVIENIQRRRNRIEHHRYDHQKEDDLIIEESCKFVLFFVEGILRENLNNDIAPELLRSIRALVLKRDEEAAMANFRLENWIKQQWSDWEPEQGDIPEEFDGTHDCPQCRQSYLVIGYHPKPFCFHCNEPIDAAICDSCGRTFSAGDGCCTDIEHGNALKFSDQT